MKMITKSSKNLTTTTLTKDVCRSISVVFLLCFVLRIECTTDNYRSSLSAHHHRSHHRRQAVLQSSNENESPPTRIRLRHALNDNITAAATVATDYDEISLIGPIQHESLEKLHQQQQQQQKQQQHLNKNNNIQTDLHHLQSSVTPSSLSSSTFKQHTKVQQNGKIVHRASINTNNNNNNNEQNNNWPTAESSLNALTTNELVFRLIGSLFGVTLIVVTIVGNVLVIVVVCKFHRMRSVTNILLASLAIADITVACLVMPFTVVHDLLRFWPWNQILCHFWISCDVMCCTASILHLCAVAIDRFWAITRPLRYRSLISKRRLFCCIVLIWLCSAAISFIPIFTGWYHAEAPINVFKLRYTPECGLNVNRIYATISSLTSFYLPLPVMFYVYFRILLVAERQSREIKQLEESLARNGFLTMNCTIQSDNHNNHKAVKKISANSTSGSGGSHLQHSIQFNSLINIETGETGQLNDIGSHVGSHLDVLSVGSDGQHSIDSKRHAERSLRRRTKQLITDTKAIRTLGIVMGVFCLCWLPFFIMYVISAYCDKCNISYELRSGITWLGYINSGLNPAIYAYLNKEFRAAFHRVICCLPGSAYPEHNERDAMLEEISTTSRSFQRGQHQLDRYHNSLDVPTTPGFMSRTPSATPDPSNWPVLQGHNLVVPDRSRKNSKLERNNSKSKSTDNVDF